MPLSVFAGAVNDNTTTPTAVDGTGTAARFVSPGGFSSDAGGNIYLVDVGDNFVRKITGASVVSTVAGSATYGSADGPAASATFRIITDTAADPGGNVYVTDWMNCTIREISSSGVVSTVAGAALMCGSADGTGGAARFNYPQGVATDGLGNVYVADTGNDTVRRIDPGGTVTTVAGTPGVSGFADGAGSSALFAQPVAVAVDGSGNIYVGDQGNQAIRRIDASGVVTTLVTAQQLQPAGTGTTNQTVFIVPGVLAVDPAGDLYFADASNDVIRKIPASGAMITVVGTPGKSAFVPGSLPGELDGPVSVTRIGTTLYTTSGTAIVQALGAP
jgi:hypothetical protein